MIFFLTILLASLLNFSIASTGNEIVDIAPGILVKNVIDDGQALCSRLKELAHISIAPKTEKTDPVIAEEKLNLHPGKAIDLSRIDARRIHETYKLLQETNKACWTVVEIDEILEDEKKQIFRKQYTGEINSENAEKFLKRLSDLQDSLDRTACQTKLRELAEKAQNLTASEQQVLRNSSEFNAANRDKYDSLEFLSHHKYCVHSSTKRNLVVQAIGSFYSKERLDQAQAEQNNILAIPALDDELANKIVVL